MDNLDRDALHASNPVPTIGTPGDDAAFFPGQQNYQDTCAIRSQEFIIEQFTGQDLPEDYYVQEAADNGWYSPGSGTSPDDMNKLLELHHIPTNTFDNATVCDLTSELAKGHKVMIGVDSDQLWQQHPILTEIKHLLGFDRADHAVVVSGIDTSDPKNVQVVVSDPGTGQAAAKYPLDQFLEAWKSSDFRMVSTQVPPPHNMQLPEMANFDYSLGHIPSVGSLTFEEFENQMLSHQLTPDSLIDQGFHGTFDAPYDQNQELNGYSADMDMSHPDTSHDAAHSDVMSGFHDYQDHSDAMHDTMHDTDQFGH